MAFPRGIIEIWMSVRVTLLLFFCKQSVEVFCALNRVWMHWAKRLFQNSESASEKWFSLAVVALSLEQARQIVQAPISTRKLTDLFSMRNDAFSESDTKSPISIGFRNGHADHIDAALASPFEANRRFALLRVVADHLYSPDMDRLLPVTTAKAARQKYQRAFAQAFLCPAEQLIGFIDGDLSDEKIDEAAVYFNVSPRLVEATLVNKGVLKRAEFADL